MFYRERIHAERLSHLCTTFARLHTFAPRWCKRGNYPARPDSRSEPFPDISRQPLHHVQDRTHRERDYPVLHSWSALPVNGAKMHVKKFLSGTVSPFPDPGKNIHTCRLHFPGANRVESLFAFANRIKQQVTAGKERADRLTQAILAKAFCGELVPTEAELARKEGQEHEPASVLLERVKKETIGKRTRI